MEAWWLTLDETIIFGGLSRWQDGFDKDAHHPLGESRPPTMLNPRLFLPWPFSKDHGVKGGWTIGHFVTARASLLSRQGAELRGMKDRVVVIDIILANQRCRHLGVWFSGKSSPGGC